MTSPSRGLRTRGARPRWRRVALLGLLVALTSLQAAPVAGHTPHDQAPDVAASPANGRTVFVLSGNRLLRSTDGGATWSQRVRGLPRTSEESEPLSGVVVSPSDERVMYLSTRGDGVYRSADSGESWEAANGGLADRNIARVVVSPRSPDVVLALPTITGLTRTVDGGRSWSTVAGFGAVGGVAFVPGRPGTAVLGDRTGGIHVSEDDGATWARRATTPDGEPVTTVAAWSDASGGTILVGTERGKVLRSVDGGRSFVTGGQGLPPQQVRSLALSPDDPSGRVVWASTWSDGAFRSSDGGMSWTRESAGLTTDVQADELSFPQFGNLSTTVGEDGEAVIFLAGFDGLFRFDGMGPWRAVETLSEFVVGLSVSPAYARDATVIVTTYVKGAYLSTDAGATWRGAHRGLEQPVSAGNELAPVRRLHNVVFSPDYGNDGTIFSATWTHLLRSTDRGRSWARIVVGAPAEEGMLRQFVIVVSPRFASDRTVYLGTRQGDVFRSTDGGDRWVPVAKVGTGVRSLVLSANGPQPVLYAGTEQGIFRSADGAVSWTPVGRFGLSMLAISPSYDTDGTVMAGTERGLFVTRDEGRTWSELSAPPLPPGGLVEALALSPAYGDDGTVLVSVGGRGLFRSTDRGRSFTEVGRDLIEDNLVIADFSNPTSQPIQFSPAYATDGTVFAYAGPRVLRSTDRGDRWQVLDLPPASAFIEQAAARPAEDRSARTAPPTTDDTSPASVVGPAVVAVALVAVVAGILIVRRRRARPAGDDLSRT